MERRGTPFNRAGVNCSICLNRETLARPQSGRMLIGYRLILSMLSNDFSRDRVASKRPNVQLQEILFKRYVTGYGVRSSSSSCVKSPYQPRIAILRRCHLVDGEFGETPFSEKNIANIWPFISGNKSDEANSANIQPCETGINNDVTLRPSGPQAPTCRH